MLPSLRACGRHQHKNTIQALSWAPHGNLLASASRDQTVRVFDIRSMKEWVVLRGHKKEVCCTSPPPSLLATPSLTSTLTSARMAPRPPDPRLRRLRRRHPALGPLLPNSRHALRSPNPPPARTRPQQRQHLNSTLRSPHRTSAPSPPARNALPSARLKRLGTNLPPSRAPTRLRLQRPHDPFLGARASRRRRVLVRSRRR
jgi:hypothetical protein